MQVGGLFAAGVCMHAWTPVQAADVMKRHAMFLTADMRSKIQAAISAELHKVLTTIALNGITNDGSWADVDFPPAKAAVLATIPAITSLNTSFLGPNQAC